MPLCTILHLRIEFSTDTYDTIIVGAGPAGLFAAHTILRNAPETRLLLVDAGRPLHSRLQLPPTDLGGAGGAGIYLGGRFYLGHSSIPFNVTMSDGAGTRPILDGVAYASRAQEIDEILLSYGGDAELREEPSARLAEAVAVARDAGLEYTISYPARIVPAEQRRMALGRMLDDLEGRGASLIFGTSVVNTTREQDGFTVTLRDGESGEEEWAIGARTLLLAPGRYGAEWLVRAAGALGADVVALPATFGVRLEMRLEAYQPLTEINPDPRLQLSLTDGATIKTYATCPGGLVTAIERYGRLVASGVPLPLGERGPNTTAAILLQPSEGEANDQLAPGKSYAELLNDNLPETLAIQRYGDARSGRVTSEDSLTANSVQPTFSDAKPWALHNVYPPRFWQAMGDLLGRIATLAPDVASDDMLIYGPAEERFWRFPTDAQLQTSVPGLFVAGDGPGQSQGAVQAGVAGLLAGAGVTEYLSATTRRRRS